MPSTLKCSSHCTERQGCEQLALARGAAATQPFVTTIQLAEFHLHRAGPTLPRPASRLAGGRAGLGRNLMSYPLLGPVSGLARPATGLGRIPQGIPPLAPQTRLARRPREVGPAAAASVAPAAWPAASAPRARRSAAPRSNQRCAPATTLASSCDAPPGSTGLNTLVADHRGRNQRDGARQHDDRPDVHSSAEKSNRRRGGATAASVAAATQAESATERLGGDREQTAARLTRVVTPVQRSTAVPAHLPRRALHDPCVDRRQLLEKLACQLDLGRSSRLLLVWQPEASPSDGV